MSLAVSEEIKNEDCSSPNPNSRKKFLFIISSLVGGGAERVISYLINEIFAKQDIRLVVLHQNENQENSDLKLANEQIKVLEKKSSWDVFQLVKSLRNEIRSYQPDYVISFLIYTNMITAIAVFLSGAKAKIILNERNYPPRYLSEVRWGLIKSFLMKITYRMADKVIANSRMTAKSLVSDYDLPIDSVDYVYNPIDLEKIDRLKDETVHHPFFASAQNKIVVAVGRLSPQKRFDLLLRAFKMLGDGYYRLLILGVGAEERSLKKLSENLGIAQRVSFIGFQKNPYAWLRRANLFVLSSDYEGFPNVILEAMACQTPVISTNCPSGPSEIIEDGVNGILVPVGQENGLSAAMARVLSSEALAHQLVMNGARTVRSYQVERIAQEYLRKIMS